MKNITYNSLKDDLEKILGKKVEFSLRNLKDIVIKYFPKFREKQIPVNSRFYLRSEDDIIFGIYRGLGGVELYPTSKKNEELKVKWEKLSMKYKELFICYMPF